MSGPYPKRGVSHPGGVVKTDHDEYSAEIPAPTLDGIRRECGEWVVTCGSCMCTAESRREAERQMKNCNTDWSQK